MRATTVLATALAALAAAAIVRPCAAQTSASFKLTETTLDDGGDPRQGTSLASAHYHVSLDAIGGGVMGVGLASASFHADQGFAADYPPPGEVAGLRFDSKTNIAWGNERSVGAYDLYRDTLTNVAVSFGNCYQSGLSSPSWVESASPPTGDGWFYIATAKNRLGEEGTKGYRTGGIERTNASPCP